MEYDDTIDEPVGKISIEIRPTSTELLPELCDPTTTVRCAYIISILKWDII